VLKGHQVLSEEGPHGCHRGNVPMAREGENCLREKSSICLIENEISTHLLS